jgi:molecular chaperone DnaK
MEASMKLGEAIYKAEAAQAAEAENAETGGASKPDDDVVDADFEEVRDDDNKKSVRQRKRQSPPEQSGGLFI